jgi:hypothetical protein
MAYRNLFLAHPLLLCRLHPPPEDALILKLEEQVQPALNIDKLPVNWRKQGSSAWKCVGHLEPDGHCAVIRLSYLCHRNSKYSAWKGLLGRSQVHTMLGTPFSTSIVLHESILDTCIIC